MGLVSLAQAPSLTPRRAPDVLVIPRRVAPRFRDLTADEVTDLFQSVHQISRVIEQEYKAQCAPFSFHSLRVSLFSTR